MDAFTITCTTCQQRLKVRDDSAIGEIQICPKCGSMVLVELPSADPTPDVAEPPVNLEPAVPPPGEPEVASDVDCSLVDHVPIGADDDQCVDADEEVAPPPIPTPRDMESTQPDGASYPAGDVQGKPMLPSADWMSEQSRRRQQLLLIGGAALVGTILAFGLFAFIVSGAFRSPADEPIKRSQPTEVVEAVETNPGQPSVEPSDAVDSGPADAIEPAPPEPAEDPATEQPAVQHVDAPQTPDPPDKKPTLPETPPAASGPHGQDANPEVMEGPGTAPDDPPTSPELAAALDQFAPFIDPGAFVKSPADSEPTQSEQPELDPAESEQDEPTVPRPEPRQVDVAERLNDTILAIEFKDGSLKDFVRFLMSFSTIPMTLDPDALALVGETPNSLVNVQQTDTTVGQVLSGALAPLRLGAVTVGEQIVITRPATPGGKLRTLSHPVGDLVGDDPAELADLANLIVELIEPDSWKGQGGDGEMGETMPSLVIVQSDTVLFRVIVFCERLRAARGLPPQSNFDRASFDLESRLSLAAPHLKTPVTLNHIEPASFVQILDQLSELASVDILIDWQAIGEIGWNPDAKTTIAANGQPVGEALTQLLVPMDLTYRVINETCVQVTSQQLLDSRLEVEFYPCRDVLPVEAGADEFEDRLRRDLGDQTLDQVGASFHIDRASGYLIAALPQPLHRKLADVLQQWRGPAP